MKGGAFRIVLAGPAMRWQREQFSAELAEVADELQFWPSRNAALRHVLRLLHVAGPLPVSVASDRSRAGSELAAKLLDEGPAAAVFDFAHSAVLLPRNSRVPTVMFTHNVEAEIFARHAKVATGVLKRKLWKRQHEKMVDFERNALRRFDSIVAVSERDKAIMAQLYAVENVHTIPTGVDADFLRFMNPADDQRVIFCGSMDWLPNIDAIDYFLSDVWPLIRQRTPRATLTVIGRTPPSWLVAKARKIDERSRFTGYVDDVRPHAAGASAFVIPLRIAGGTRIKAFEAMAMGCPVVSTSIGVEGLPLVPGEHYLRADSTQDLAAAIGDLLEQKQLRQHLAETARQYVEENFSFRVAARVFEDICLRTAGLSRA
jgi:glycosyltransferase involved in cell wall biosynthesis